MLKLFIFIYILILSLFYSPSVTHIDEPSPPTPKILNPHPEAIPNDPYREDLHGAIECSCIRSVRSFGFDLPYGTDAENLKPNAQISIGVLALFQFSNSSHVAYVTRIEEKGFWVKEGNYPIACEFSERFVDFGDWSLAGFYSYPQK